MAEGDVGNNMTVPGPHISRKRKMTSPDYYNLLRQNAAFSILTDEQLQQLINISSEIHLDQGAYLFHEGDSSKEIFIIIEGRVEIIKLDKVSHRKHAISQLIAGETVGELALFDQGPRSASIRATTAVRLLRIPFDILHKLADQNPRFNKVLLNIANNLSTRLRQTNDFAIQTLEKQIKEYKIRMSMGTFMINVIVSLCLFSIALGGLTYLEKIINPSAVTFAITSIFLIFYFFIVKSSHLPLSAFGFTTHHWQEAVKEAIFFTLIACVMVLFVKWVFIHTLPNYSGHPLFEPYKWIIGSNPTATPLTTWSISLAIYLLVISPVQEMIARGGLQGPLEEFLTGKHKLLKTIIISNLMFATIHLFLSLWLSFMVFIVGLYFGWLYSRHRTLAGVIVAHALLGAWGLWIVGI